MDFGRLTMNWRTDWAYPWLSRCPTRLPWTLATKVGRQAQASRRLTAEYLKGQFMQLFPSASSHQLQAWAKQHETMLALEMLDSLSFGRLGTSSGPQLNVLGLENATNLKKAGKGFILVLNHLDRLLTAPVALALNGIQTHVLTMPVDDNPELGESDRLFLRRKISEYTRVTGGAWHTTAQSMRPVLDGLRAGDVWVILADAWRPEFKRMRGHAFVGGELQLPTGVERLATNARVPMVYASTETLSHNELLVRFETLPDDPVLAIDLAIQRLEEAVSARPWAWWHWGQIQHMWQPSAGEVH